MAVGTLVQVFTWARYATGSRPGSGESPDGRLRPRGRSDRGVIEALDIALDITAPYAGPPRLSAVLRPGHCFVMHPITNVTEGEPWATMPGPDDRGGFRGGNLGTHANVRNQGI